MSMQGICCCCNMQSEEFPGGFLQKKHYGGGRVLSRPGLVTLIFCPDGFVAVFSPKKVGKTWQQSWQDVWGKWQGFQRCLAKLGYHNSMTPVINESTATSPAGCILLRVDGWSGSGRTGFLDREFRSRRNLCKYKIAPNLEIKMM